MKKIIAIFLISIFVFTNTSIGQLFKVPNLVEHFNEHSNEVATSTFSFINFLELHYSKNAENNQKDHQDLPFKTFDNVTSFLISFSNNHFQIEELKPLITGKKKFFYNKSFKSNSITSIWLPPKIS